MKHFVFSLLVTFSAVLVLAATDAERDEPLAFSPWKSQQVLSAQNLTIRLSNKIIMLKASKSATQSEISKHEADLRAAVQNLDVVRDLTIEDYVTVYLSKFSNDSAGLEKVSGSLTKEEMAQILKLIFKNKTNAISFEHLEKAPIKKTSAENKKGTTL